MGEYDYRFNPNHVPAGSAGGGQFAPASGGGTVAQDKRPAPTNQHPVGMGERGKRVHDLQERLNALGIKPPLAVDGIFGPKTLAAVRKFQQSHGLKVDGLVGPKTTAALRLRHTADPHHGHHHDHHDHQHASAHKAATHKPSAQPARPTAPANAGKLAALSRTAETPTASTVHEPFGSPSGPGLFHVKGLQLPAYVQHVAHHLAAMGHPESQAIQIAIGVIKDWAAGRTPGGKGHVHPDVQAAASKALAEWEAAKAAAHGKSRDFAAPAERRSAPVRERGWVPPPSPRI